MARTKKKYFRVMGFDGYFKAKNLLASSTVHRIHAEYPSFEEAEAAALEWMAAHPPRDVYRDKAYLVIEHTRYGSSAVQRWTRGDDGQWELTYDLSKLHRKKKRTRKKKAAKKNPSMRSIMAKALK